MPTIVSQANATQTIVRNATNLNETNVIELPKLNATASTIEVIGQNVSESTTEIVTEQTQVNSTSTEQTVAPTPNKQRRRRHHQRR